MEKFLELLDDETKYDWRDSHKELKHIFFDENQDITNANYEPRRKACEKLIELASKDCGITVCGDTLNKYLAMC